MPKLINRNSNKILNAIPKKSLLKKIGNKFNQSLSNENILEKKHNLIINNNSGFNTTKNSLNISYNSFFLTKKNLDNDKNKKRYFSKFFYKSQSKNITSKRIYEHYIKEEERDKVEPEKPFLKFGAPRSIKQLKNLYKDNVKFQKRLKELKLNKSIAFKDDFNVLEYQSTLVKLLSKRISLKNLYGLQKEFIVFNEKNFGLVGPKGRFTNMAEKIKYNISFYLYEKIRKLDTDKLISRYNYYKRINERISNNIKKKYELKKKKKKNEISRDSGDNSIGFQYDSLYSSPEYLIINLNRGNGKIYNIKVYLEEFIDLNNYVESKVYNNKYRLISIIKHFGQSGTAGHYIAFCYVEREGDWFKFNDALVERSSFKEGADINNGDSYVLIYKRTGN